MPGDWRISASSSTIMTECRYSEPPSLTIDDGILIRIARGGQKSFFLDDEHALHSFVDSHIDEDEPMARSRVSDRKRQAAKITEFFRRL